MVEIFYSLLLKLHTYSASCSLSVKGFHHRKLLHQHLDSSDATMACGANCSPTPSPLQSPLALPQPVANVWFPPLVGVYHMNHDYVLRLTMIVIACMFGMVMFLCIMFSILRNYYSRRHNHSRRNPPILFDIHGDSPLSDDEGPAMDHPIWFIRTVGLQQSVIDSITVFKYRKDEGLIDGTECSVCLGEFQQDESLRLLPKCSHAFHIPCIDTWLRSHKNCPLCRAPVVHDAGGAEVRAMEPDSNVSGQNEETQIENLDGGAGNHHVVESESSGLRIGDDDSGMLSSEEGGDNEIPDKILSNSDKMNCHSSIVIGSQEVEEEIQPMRRSVSMDSSSASMIFCDVVDINSDLESSDTHLDDKKDSRNKDIIVAKQGSGSSTIYKLASIGRALQKRPISLRRSFSRNRKFLFSRHCRSQSSTLPL